MMHLNLYCPDCLAELAKQKKDFDLSMTEPIISVISELNDDGIYPVSCAKGHSGKVILSNLKFELLFELGINAIVDGYYREAVSSCTSALERYFEFFIKVIWTVSGHSEEQISKIWKKMSNQSERQLGAYIALFVEKFSEEPLLLDDKNTNFRNSVIHKGYVPKRDEAILYSKKILDLIEKSLILLKAKYPEITRLTSERLFPKYESKSKDENTLTLNELTIINVLCGRENNVEDLRNGTIESQIERILSDKQTNTRLRLFDKKQES
jgi:hypothetical protein